MSQERTRGSTTDRLPGRRAWLPFGFVILSLVALQIVPFLLQRHTESIRTEIEDVVEPAREAASRLPTAFSRQIAGIRGYAATSDPQWLVQFCESEMEWRRSLDRLRQLATEIGGDLPSAIAELQARYAEHRVQVDALLEGRVTPDAFIGMLPQQEAHAESTLAAAARVEAAVTTAHAGRRSAIARGVQMGAILTGILALLAIAAGGVVLWLGVLLGRQARREAEARGEAERRERQELALRRAARAVSATFTVAEVIEEIAGSALEATGADAAVVERIDTDTNTLVVVATAGEPAPPHGTRTSYQDSYGQRALERAAPELVERLGAAELALPGDLAEACADCSGVVVPLLNAGEPVGVLFLVRRPERWVFRSDEAERAYAFGDLASLALRKLHLLEDAERRREELQRVMESRARLMRGFSHDVKNPIGAADGMLQILELGMGNGLSEKQKQNVERARRAIHAALDLIDRLLDLARAEAGEIEIELAPTDVRQAAYEIGEEYRAQAESKGLSVELRFPDELPVIESDPPRIRQILGNLISNAVKYAERGGITVSAGMRSGPTAPGPGEWVAVDVIDTGPGIPEDQLPRLFREFSRLDATGKQGTGVGLAISKRLAGALGGEITVQSEPGRGSTFTLWLPVAGLPASESARS